MESLGFGLLVGITVAVILNLFTNIKCAEHLKQIREQLENRKE